MSNSILQIKPYVATAGGAWVFDDSDVGLKREPFVGDVNTMIDNLVLDAGIENAEDGFLASFSHQPFPGWGMKLIKLPGATCGTDYFCPTYDMEGWLCPALFKYFPSAPDEIYVKAEPLRQRSSPATSLWDRCCPSWMGGL